MTRISGLEDACEGLWRLGEWSATEVGTPQRVNAYRSRHRVFACLGIVRRQCASSGSVQAALRRNGMTTVLPAHRCSGYLRENYEDCADSARIEEAQGALASFECAQISIMFGPSAVPHAAPFCKPLPRLGRARDVLRKPKSPNRRSLSYLGHVTNPIETTSTQEQAARRKVSFPGASTARRCGHGSGL